MSILNFFRRLMGIETSDSETIDTKTEARVKKPAASSSPAKPVSKPKKHNPYQGKKKPVGGKSL